MVDIIKILEYDVCDMCGRGGCNMHCEGKKDKIDVRLCSVSGDCNCSGLYEDGVVDMNFIRTCSKKIKAEVSIINKSINNNYRAYEQLHLDMLKFIFKHIYLKRHSKVDYYIKQIKEELDNHKNYGEDYDTELLSKEERVKEETKRIKLELAELKEKERELTDKLKGLK